MMKKTMKWLGTLAFMLMCVLALTLSACGGDDDDGGGGGNVDNPGQMTYSIRDVVGIWKLVHMVGYEGNEVFDFYESDLTYEGKRRLTISADGSFLEEDQKGDNVHWRTRHSGTIQISGDIVYVTRYYDDASQKTSIMTIKGLTATQLVLYEKSSKYEQTLTFQRVSSSSSDDNNTSSTGTINNPLTASQIYDIVAAMPPDSIPHDNYYAKGKICSIKYSFSAEYGTAVFDISDNGSTGGKKFTVYNAYYKANGQKWVEGNTQVSVGDEVVVAGKVVNYRGTTPEFVEKQSYVVSINGF